MNDCPDGEMRDLLPDLLNGRLDGAEREAVEAHLTGCADCRAELALLGQLRGTLRRAPVVDVGAIVAALPRRHAPARQSWRGWRAAAVLAIAVGGTSIAIARHDPGEVSVTPEVATAPAAIPVPPIASNTVEVAQPAGTTAKASVAPRRTHELAVSGAVSDLSDAELGAILDNIESLDALPPVDVEQTTLVPASVTPSRGTS